jgi:putative heme-binding domain-containing protein
VQRPFAALVFGAAAVLLGAGAPVAAQHATAYDVEDGERVFASICANCHGPDGNLIAGIDLGRGQFRRDYTDRELVSVISNGIPNTPMPANLALSDEQVERIVAWLRSNGARRDEVAVTGDAARGRELFENKGECLDCHRVAGRGSRLGPDLSGIGLLRRAAELEQSIVDPQAEVQPNNRSYRVVTADGREVKGRLLNHDTYTVQLLDEDERLRSFALAGLREHGFDQTPMPSYRKKLDASQVADVVAYLVSLQRSGAR